MRRAREQVGSTVRRRPVDGTGTVRAAPGPAVMGRREQADVRVCDCWAGRRPCRLSLEESGLVVEDLGSRNGTLVNGVPVATASLRPGDRLTVGLTTSVVEFDPGLLRATDRAH